VTSPKLYESVRWRWRAANDSPDAAGRAGDGVRADARDDAGDDARRHHLRIGLRDICIGLLVWGLYSLLASDHAGTVTGADSRGRSLLAAESWLHIDIERAANRWLSGHEVLGWFAAWEYAITYIVTTFAVLGWAWWRRPEHYAWARNTLLWTTLLAIGCFALWPTTPPRLLPGSGFVDIVAAHHPLLSWGGGAVSAGANQYAAMPSLHIGWAVWVSVVTLRTHATRSGSFLALLHVGVTALVVVATGNHYVLDIVAGAAVVAIAVFVEAALAHRRQVVSPGERVAAADEFFLEVETATVQQPVGGFVLLDHGQEHQLELSAFRRLLAERLPAMPRLEQRLLAARGLHHARWCPAEVDLTWHVREHVLPGDGGRQALADFIAELTEQQLDRSRPLWQIWYVPNVSPTEASAVAIMHHAVGDGLGVVDILRQLFDPVLPPPDTTHIKRPSLPKSAAAAVAGVAELAADGTADALAFTQPLSGRRAYSMATLPMASIRAISHRTGSRVSDLLLTAVGEAVTHLLAERGQATAGLRLRAAVPITTRLPAPAGTGRRPKPGNLTAALRLDVPLGPMPILQRLAAVRRSSERRRHSARAFGAAAVMRATGALPPALQRVAARAVYQGRHFTAIVSNMPGPTAQLNMVSTPIRDVYPILPLAQGVPLGIGTLGWAGQYSVSVITDAAVLPHADAFLADIVAAIEEAGRALGLAEPAQDIAGSEALAGR
jgi:Ca2+/Na+ antiporter